MVRRMQTHEAMRQGSQRARRLPASCLLPLAFCLASVGCIAPQVHLHFGEKHYHHEGHEGHEGATTPSGQDVEGDELERDPRWGELETRQQGQEAKGHE